MSGKQLQHQPNTTPRKAPSPLIQNLLAQALRHHQSGQFPDAERIYRQILTLNPDHADSVHLLGMLAFQEGRNQAAAALIRQAIALNKREALYHSNLGIVLQAQGQLEDSLACYRRAVALNPNYAEAHNNLGVTLGSLGRNAEAMSQYERVLALNPNHAIAHTNLGVLLFDQGKTNDAIIHYQQALALEPASPETLSNLGNAFDAQDNLDAAIACYVQAVTLKPDYTTAFTNLGNALQSQNKLDDALACYDHVLSLQPQSADALHSKALTQLLRAEFSPGWLNYEYRWLTTGHAPARVYPQPRWTGEKLSSGTLLLWGEQGVGDEIMFAGLIPDVIRTGNRCLLECDPRLKPLFARSFPSLEIIPAGQIASPDIAAHLPTGSLPGIFRNTTAAFQSTTSPYLIADPAQRQHFRSRYAGTRLAVGLAWYTSNKKNGHRRSIPLSTFAPLFAHANISWVSLQYGVHEVLQSHATAANAPLLIDRSVNQFTDIDTFAAQIAALDLVITIDNSTAHLAGALGVPTWLLLPWVRDWRWLLDRDDSPWYPSLRLFRQPKLGDWQTVVQTIQLKLKTL